MAQAKKKASKRKPAPASASLPQSQDIPKGMKAIGSGYAPSWDVDKLPTLHGTVSSEIKTVPLKQGRKTTDRRCVEVTSKVDQQKHTVWESATLAELFDQLIARGKKVIGTEVWMHFDGFGKKKAGQNAPKLFTVAIGS